jgi:hypothetical protein
MRLPLLLCICLLLFTPARSLAQRLGPHKWTGPHSDFEVAPVPRPVQSVHVKNVKWTYDVPAGWVASWPSENVLCYSDPHSSRKVYAWIARPGELTALEQRLKAPQGVGSEQHSYHVLENGVFMEVGFGDYRGRRFRYARTMDGQGPYLIVWEDAVGKPRLHDLAESIVCSMRRIP